MTIEDINYLKENSVKQSYTFLVDSQKRNKRIHPNPSEYSVNFEVPFKHVIGMEVLDVSVPKTMYNIDYNNNTLYFCFLENIVQLTNEKGEIYYDKSQFLHIKLPIGDYKTTGLVAAIQTEFSQNNFDLQINTSSYPSDLTNTVYFSSSKEFVIDAEQSSIASLIGLGNYVSSDAKYKNDFTYKNYNDNIGFESLYHSVYNNFGRHIVKPPGMLYLINQTYIILRCPEIEQHLYRSLAYSKYSMGMAKIRINSYGYNDDKTSFLKVPLREFHPIGKLSKITLRFELPDGTLYDFKGVNHNITFALYFYEPSHVNVLQNSILNPEYNPNFIKYLYKQEDQEGDSDDENDFSRDNIEIYKKREIDFSDPMITLNDAKIAFDLKKTNEDRNMLLQNIRNKIYPVHDTSEVSQVSDDSDTLQSSGDFDESDVSNISESSESESSDA